MLAWNLFKLNINSQFIANTSDFKIFTKNLIRYLPISNCLPRDFETLLCYKLQLLESSTARIFQLWVLFISIFLHAMVHKGLFLFQLVEKLLSVFGDWWKKVVADSSCDLLEFGVAFSVGLQSSGSMHPQELRSQLLSVLWWNFGKSLDLSFWVFSHQTIRITISWRALFFYLIQL